MEKQRKVCGDVPTNRAVGFGGNVRAVGESGIAAMCTGRNDGHAEAAGSRFVSTRLGNIGNPAGNNTKCSPS